MTIAVTYGSADFSQNHALEQMIGRLREAGNNIISVAAGEDLPIGTDMLISVGGDGTFLRSAAVAAPLGIPVLGVNAGHLGFLSENAPFAVADALCEGRYSIEDRSLLRACTDSGSFVALNEVSVRREDGQMLGVSVVVDDNLLPTYWADGLLVATPSGSTAYSLSLGGPIVMPSSKVFLIVPIAPHNLNVRPLIVPDSSEISISFHCRSDKVHFSADNNFSILPSNSNVVVNMAQFSLKRVCLDDNSFIKALSEKLFWGEDKRNKQ